MYNPKQVVALRYYFLGAEMMQASKALECCVNVHTELRKDGVTPYYLHPVSICAYLLTLEKHLLFPEETYAVALLHDVIEDQKISRDSVEELFSPEVARAVILLSKYTASGDYYWGIKNNAIASVVKGADRINNLQTMPGVFSKEKQKSYIEETVEAVLPCIKESRRIFPEQYHVYENIKFVLNSQIRLLEKKDSY